MKKDNTLREVQFRPLCFEQTLVANRSVMTTGSQIKKETPCRNPQKQDPLHFGISPLSFCHMLMIQTDQTSLMYFCSFSSISRKL